MRNILSLVFILVQLFLATSVIGQNKRYIYYFDKDLNPTKKSGAVFIGNGVMEDGYLHLSINDPATNKTLIRSMYKDSSLRVSEGIYEEFFVNGQKAAEGHYENGTETGTWKKWDDAGKLLDSTIYEKGKKVNISTFGYYKNGKLSYAYFNDVMNDKEKRYGYDDSGKVNFEGNFAGQNGILKRYTKTGIVLDTVNSKEEIEAQFPGGEQAWSKYVAGKISQNYERLLKDGTEGTCRIRFIIDVNGKVTDVKPITMEGTLLAEIAVSIIRNAPKWIPAKQYGRFVKAYREQPIGFSIKER